MKTDKKFGFTLSEVLIVLVIIGIIAVLTLPSLLKDIQAKAKVNALTSTIDNVQKAIDKELVEKRANTLNDTNIISNQGEFFREHFSLAPNPQSPFAASYRFYSGATPSGDDLPPLSATCLLKNGVAIGLHENGTIMAIDVNGADKPNIVGVDYFVVEISDREDNATGRHLGDVGFTMGDETSCEARRAACAGTTNANSCYQALVLSGFNPRYIEAGSCNN